MACPWGGVQLAFGNGAKVWRNKGTEIKVGVHQQEFMVKVINWRNY